MLCVYNINLYINIARNKEYKQIYLYIIIYIYIYIYIHIARIIKHINIYTFGILCCYSQEKVYLSDFKIHKPCFSVTYLLDKIHKFYIFSGKKNIFILGSTFSKNNDGLIYLRERCLGRSLWGKLLGYNQTAICQTGPASPMTFYLAVLYLIVMKFTFGDFVSSLYKNYGVLHIYIYKGVILLFQIVLRVSGV